MNRTDIVRITCMLGVLCLPATADVITCKEAACSAREDASGGLSAGSSHASASFAHAGRGHQLLLQMRSKTGSGQDQLADSYKVSLEGPPSPLLAQTGINRERLVFREPGASRGVAGPGQELVHGTRNNS